MHGEKYFRSGVEYLRMNKMDLKIKIVNMRLNFENLFKDDKRLNEVGNTLVNDNVDLFVKDIEPALESSLCKFSAKILKFLNTF